MVRSSNDIHSQRFISAKFAFGHLVQCPISSVTGVPVVNVADTLLETNNENCLFGDRPLLDQDVT